MKIYITILFATLLFSGCSVVKKTSAGAAIPFAVIGDTILVPFQFIGSGYTPLMNLGDDHYMKVYQENKFKTTLALSQAATYAYYIPGYLCLPFDYYTPEKYYSMTKSCLRIIKFDEKDNRKLRIRKLRYKKAPPRKEFKEW